MRHGRRGRRQLAAMDQINITPLLDLTFVLLIAFMLIMPPLVKVYGTGVEIPKMNSQDLPKDDDKNLKSVTLAKDGRIMLDDETMASADVLCERIRELKSRNPNLKLLLCADGENSYKKVIDLMAKIRRSGFEEVTLVTQGEGDSE